MNTNENNADHFIAIAGMFCHFSIIIHSEKILVLKSTFGVVITANSFSFGLPSKPLQMFSPSVTLLFFLAVCHK